MMENEKRPIDASPLVKNGWHLVKTGESNKFLAQMSLADVPTVDAKEVVHGWWERYIDEDEDVHYYTCSACNYMVIPQYKYCPNCGAKMDGGNENG